MGRAADALKSLDKAIERGWTGAGHMAQDPDLESVRKDPKFQALLSTLRAKSAGRSFRSARDRAKGALDHTYMAVMLGYTGPRGNSVPEILGYLRAAAASDGTHPVGTVYLCKNKDVRSTTRQYGFAGTQGALKRMGRKVEILQEGQSGQTGILPVGKAGRDRRGHRPRGLRLACIQEQDPARRDRREPDELRLRFQHLRTDEGVRAALARRRGIQRHRRRTALAVVEVPAQLHPRLLRRGLLAG